MPQNIPGGEIYQALEKGTIDAAEWVGPYDDLKLGFYKVAPYYYYPGWWEGGPQLTLYVNQKAYDALSPEYKAIIEARLGLRARRHAGQVRRPQPGALKQLVAGGTKLFRFPKDVMDAAFKAAMELYAELNASNPAWKKIYDDYANFRRDAEPVVPLHRGGASTTSCRRRSSEPADRLRAGAANKRPRHRRGFFVRPAFAGAPASGLLLALVVLRATRAGPSSGLPWRRSARRRRRRGSPASGLDAACVAAAAVRHLHLLERLVGVDLRPPCSMPPVTMPGKAMISADHDHLDAR